MEEKSLLAQLLSSQKEELYEEIVNTPLNELLRQQLEEVGLYVFESSLDGKEDFMHFGNITVATDGAPERARRAVEEVLRSQAIEEFRWPDWGYFEDGRIRVAWEVWYDKEAQ